MQKAKLTREEGESKKPRPSWQGLRTNWQLSLQVRIAAVLGLSLIILQGVLGFSFDQALDQARQKRVDGLKRSAQSAVEYALALEVRRQLDSLETFADISRQNFSKIETEASARASRAASRAAARARSAPADVGDSEAELGRTEEEAIGRKSDDAGTKPGFFARLFGTKSSLPERSASPEPPEIKPPPREKAKPKNNTALKSKTVLKPKTEPLLNRIRGLQEYTDGYPVIWYKQSAEFPELSSELREKARKLELDTVGSAQKLVCGTADCVVMGIVPFQTRDKKQIVAVEVLSLTTMLQGIGLSAGYSLRLMIGSETVIDTVAKPLAVVKPGAESSLKEQVRLFRLEAEKIARKIRRSSSGRSLEIAAPSWWYSGQVGDLVSDVPLIGIELNEDVLNSGYSGVRLQYFTIAGIGVLLALLLGALLYQAPINRIRRLRAALPHLSRSDFQTARTMLSSQISKTWVRDETADLLITANEITEQLAKLEDERAQKAAELLCERDRVRRIFDTAPAAIVVLDRAGHILSANHMTSRLVGIAHSELPGIYLPKLFTGLHERGFSQALVTAIEDEVSSQYEFELRSEKGSFHQVKWRIVRMPDTEDDQILAVGLDVSGLRESERRLSWLRTHDEVTGLLSRRAFESRIRELKNPCCLVFVRPEQQAVLWNQESNEQRDLLQTSVGKIVSDLGQEFGASEVALIERLEFAILIEADQSMVESKLRGLNSERLRCPINISDRTASLDLCLLGVELDADACASNLDDQLDAMLNLTEIHGAGVHWIAAEALSERRLDDYRFWVNQIDEAIREDRILLYYQPIFDSQTLKSIHSEVLLRMLKKDGSVITAGDFISAAQRSGQLRQLEKLVLSKAIDSVLDMQSRNIEHRLAVNVSAAALQDPFLIDLIKDAIDRRGMNPDGLMLELLETQAIERLESAARSMQDLVKMGIKFALDDFGTGFASFEYLRELPFSYVKIDQSFVRHLAHRKEDQSLIQSMHEMVSGFGRITIAEGVEDFASLAILQKIGVCAAQGFGLARPSPEINLNAVNVHSTHANAA